MKGAVRMSKTIQSGTSVVVHCRLVLIFFVLFFFVLLLLLIFYFFV